MKALVYVGEEKLDFREVADPVVKSGEQLIKVDSAGICGSDMHCLLYTSPSPRDKRQSRMPSSA